MHTFCAFCLKLSGHKALPHKNVRCWLLIHTHASTTATATAQAANAKHLQLVCQEVLRQPKVRQGQVVRGHDT